MELVTIHCSQFETANSFQTRWNTRGPHAYPSLLERFLDVQSILNILNSTFEAALPFRTSTILDSARDDSHQSIRPPSHVDPSHCQCARVSFDFPLESHMFHKMLRLFDQITVDSSSHSFTIVLPMPLSITSLMDSCEEFFGALQLQLCSIKFPHDRRYSPFP